MVFKHKFQDLCFTKAVSLVTIFYMFRFHFAGGRNYEGSYLDDVLMFDPKSSNWIKVGSMKTARYSHGTSLVNMDDVISYCN